MSESSALMQEPASADGRARIEAATREAVQHIRRILDDGMRELEHATDMEPAPWAAAAETGMAAAAAAAAAAARSTASRAASLDSTVQRGTEVPIGGRVGSVIQRHICGCRVQQTARRSSSSLPAAAQRMSSPPRRHQQVRTVLIGRRTFWLMCMCQKHYGDNWKLAQSSQTAYAGDAAACVAFVRGWYHLRRCDFSRATVAGELAAGYTNCQI